LGKKGEKRGENENVQGQFGTSFVRPTRRHPALFVSHFPYRGLRVSCSVSSPPKGLIFAYPPSKVYIGSDRTGMTVPTEEELLAQQIKQQKIDVGPFDPSLLLYFSFFWPFVCVKASNIGELRMDRNFVDRLIR
jgi:hypothetical protein